MQLEHSIHKLGMVTKLSAVGEWRQSIEALQDSVCQGIKSSCEQVLSIRLLLNQMVSLKHITEEHPYLNSLYMACV